MYTPHSSRSSHSLQSSHSYTSHSSHSLHSSRSLHSLHSSLSLPLLTLTLFDYWSIVGGSLVATNNFMNSGQSTTTVLTVSNWYFHILSSSSLTFVLLFLLLYLSLFFPR